MRAVYAGSFDPITNGHLDIIKRAAVLCDELVVAVGVHRSKTPWFDQDHRISLIQQALDEHGLGAWEGGNIRVDSFEGLLADYVRDNELDAIIRGIRVLSDFDAEFRMGLANRDLAGVETLFLLTDPNHIFLSSSMVKEILMNSKSNDALKNITHYVPGPVAEALIDRSKR